MGSILVGLVIGVISSLIAGLLLLPEGSNTLTITNLLSSAYVHWEWSLTIVAASVCGALAFSYRVQSCLWIIDRSAYGWEQVRVRMADKGIMPTVSRKVISAGLDASLIEWDREGQWRADTSHDPPDLRVTNSDKGGILRKTMSWTDYEFEFETRIENVNTSWIIRAYDLNNCVMLQCWPDKIIPHYRRDGLWWREKERALAIVLPRSDWFRVRIRIQDDEATAYLLEDGEKTVLFRGTVLGPRTVSLIPCVPTQSNPNQVEEKVFVSYLRGGVGFREGTNESAYFRNVVVRQIGDDE